MKNSKLKISTWNLCLGISNKRDYIRSTLIEEEIDILNMQETELHPDNETNQLSIKGYKLELEKNSKKIRVGIYIANRIKYRRRTDLELEDGHIIVLDLKLNSDTRLINIYRPFTPPHGSEVEFFERQIESLKFNMTLETIITGDFNLDLNKKSTSTTSNYYGVICSRNLTKFTETHNLSQIITKDTWFRNINGTLKSSRIDHVYITDKIKTSTPMHFETAYSDHQLITFDIINLNNINEENTPIWTRSWYRYSKDKLIEELNKKSWKTSINNVQDHYDWLIQNLLEVVDELVPIKKRKCINISTYHVNNNKDLVNKHRKLVAKWKRTRKEEDKIAANIIKKTT
jgi:hypothetical protein